MKMRNYVVIWIVATLVIFSFLVQMSGYAEMLNDSGLVRGATQKLIKEELYGVEDDALIWQLDFIIADLRSQENSNLISKMADHDYYLLMDELEPMWSELKETIKLYREDSSYADLLYQQSEDYFLVADQMVISAEVNANEKSFIIMCLYSLGFILSFVFLKLQHNKNQRDIKRSASIDTLTGLYTRLGFETRAFAWLHRHESDDCMVASIDMDNFRRINYVYSYGVGDKLLCEIAKMLYNPQDDCVCARIDADNFLVLSKYSDDIIDKLQAKLDAAVDTLDAETPLNGVSFSYGVYRIKYKKEPVKTMIDKANTALKIAKDIPNTSVVLYNDDLVQKIERENYYSDHIDLAIEQQEFQMYLQPKYDLSTMEIISAEALVRWSLPDGKLAFPDDFIPLFERSGIIKKLDFYMLEAACRFSDRHRKKSEKPLSIAVNFSRVTLCQTDFYKSFVAIVDSFNLPHNCIEVEVVESTLNELDDSVMNILTLLRENGFLVSMDDFGAGYSSLNILSHIPVDIIKLDRQFLWGIDNNEKMKTIITHTVNMAQTLGITVICEGVEQEHHVDFLKSINCNFAQGYYLAKPMPSLDFAKIMNY